MGDTKDGRDKQAQDERRRQIERATKEELTRYHETEPPRELDDALEELEYPAPADQVVEAAGEYEVQTEDDAIPVAEVVEESARDEYESPRTHARSSSGRPLPRRCAAWRRSAERRDSASSSANAGTPTKKTLRALEDVDADDEDEGIAFVTAWLIDEMRENERLPKSRKVRKRAAKFCRSNGYEVRNDDWLGA